MPPDPVLKIVDAEAGGDISRVIVDGAPPLRGTTVAERCADFAARYDHLRWKLIQPPHGALHMCPVLLLEARAEDADFGVVIMESMGYPPISGSNLFCAAAVALETGVVAIQQPETRLRVATPGGLVAVTARCDDGRCLEVGFENTPARIKSVLPAVPGDTPQTPITIVAAGVDYAAVDALRLGVPLTPESHDLLLAHGARLASLAGTDFVLFHEAVESHGETADCRVAVFQKPSVICRSPTGTGTSALLTLARTRGMIGPGITLTTRSPWGGSFQGRVIAIDDARGGNVVRTVIEGAVRTGPALSIA